eukprot:XP_011431202.1 PREDICTED: uncharacterized protein LOC105330949 [Crassostrea gigas]
MSLLPVSLLSLLLLRSAPSLGRTLTFKDDGCKGTYKPSPQESFMVNHTGAPLHTFCRDMSFSGWDYDHPVEVCVKVTDYKIDCSQKLEYRKGTNWGKPTKSCDCNDDVETIPIFCTFKLLYIRIQGDEQSENTRVLYTVYSGKERPQNSDPKSSLIVVFLGTTLLTALFFTSCIFGYYMRHWRAPQHRNHEEVATYNPSQQPQININHCYHPVPNQDVSPNQNPGHGQPSTSSLQGYSVPAQGP